MFYRRLCKLIGHRSIYVIQIPWMVIDYRFCYEPQNPNSKTDFKQARFVDGCSMWQLSLNHCVSKKHISWLSIVHETPYSIRGLIAHLDDPWKDDVSSCGRINASSSSFVVGLSFGRHMMKIAVLYERLDRRGM